MKVRYNGKIYTFDPDDQRKFSVCTWVAEHFTFLPLKWRVWLTKMGIISKGISVDKDESAIS